jgi:hypothetical protein
MRMSNPNRKWQTLTESVEEAWRDVCWRCVPGALIPVDLATAQKKVCKCAESCGYQFCAGEPTLAATALNDTYSYRYCSECGDRLSDQHGAVSGLCPECEGTNVWGR